MARKPDDWMPLQIGPYLADTTHLTRDQHGAYLLLLMAYWRRGGPLPADDARLAAIAKATPAEWRKIKPVLLEFFREEDGAWHQKRADEELEKASRLTEAKAAAGRKGAEKKWQAHGTGDGTVMAEPSNSHRQNDAPLPSPIPKPEGKKKDNALARFDEFWNACPKKTGRGAAEKAWPKALAQADANTLIAAMKTYSATQAGKEAAYIKTPGPWLNEKRWLDDGIAPKATLDVASLREQRDRAARLNLPTDRIDRAIEEAEARAA